jgi:predicted outer membrane repeat protein
MALDDSTIDIEYSTFNNNQAVLGGAVYTSGTATVIQSTFVDNLANAAVRERILESIFFQI